MVYTLSAEEIVQLIGIKSGTLTDIIDAALNNDGSILDLDKQTPIITQISDLSNEISSLALELLTKVERVKQ
jgi:hypothetical protein